MIKEEIYLKKVYCIVSVILLLASMFTGCGQSAQTSSTAPTPAITTAPESSQAEPTTPPEETTEPSAAESESVLSESTVEDTATEPVSGSTVYMTTDISPAGLMAVYNALGWEPTGKVAVKLSTGEPPASNYLRPELISDVVKTVNGTIVECNTAYGGSRSETAMHYQVAEDHGFTDIADFQILDENGSMNLPVTGGTSMTNAWGGEQDAFLESMAEAGKAVSDYLGNGERICYPHTLAHQDH